MASLRGWVDNVVRVLLGSFRAGEFTILELEKLSTDDSWHIAATTTHHTLALSDDESDGEEEVTRRA